MNLDPLIVELLQENKNVIVPGLGSFIKSEGTTSYTILFNQFLKYNDKLLQKKIQSSTDCPEKEALEIIQGYTNSVLSQLETEGNYLIPGLGILLTKSGKIDFQHTAEITPEIPTSDNRVDIKSTEESNPVSSEDPTVNLDSVNQNDTENESVLQDESSNEKEVIDSNQTEELADNFEPPASKQVKPKRERSNIPPADISQDNESKKEQSPTDKPVKLESANSKPKKKKGLLWIGTFLILSGISLLCWLRWDGIMVLLNNSEPKLAEHSTEELPVVLDSVYKNNRISDTAKIISNRPVSDTIQTDTTIKPTINLDTNLVDTSTSIINEVIEPPVPTVISSSDKLYHIIGGSFSKESNALNLVENLNQKGFSNALIIGKRNEMYTVSYGGYISKEEAKKKADEIVKSGENEGVWILFY